MQPGSTFAAIVGAVIANLREEFGISQAILAEEVGIGQPAWSRIEKGESALSIDQLARAAKAMQTSPAEILLRAENTAEEMRSRDLTVSYEKPSRTSSGAIKSGLLLLGGAALAALIYAANKK